MALMEEEGGMKGVEEAQCAVEYHCLGGVELYSGRMESGRDLGSS